MSESKVIEINGRKVGDGYPAYIIAEMSDRKSTRLNSSHAT